MKKILLFDVDGTLTESGKSITTEMVDILQQIKNINSNYNIIFGIVGGGTYEKISIQLKNSIQLFKYIFCECGAVIYEDNILVSKKNILDNCNRLYLNNIIRHSLKFISDMPIIYNGNQIDFRQGLIYLSPVGMQATQFEREFFKKIDNEMQLREKFIAELKKNDPQKIFEFVLGGEVGIAMFPVGWNKAQILEYFKDEKEIEIYYFGDKTEPGGNDYEIYSHPKVKGINVKNYLDTINKLKKLFTL